MAKTKIGIIGCGNISPVYFKASRRMQDLELVGCADMLIERAQARATEFDTKAFTVEEMLVNPDVQIIVNLTIPKAHGEVGLRAVKAGKSVYNEKPLALSRAEAAEMLDTAQRNNVRVGGAPDTFLGAGMQTCRKLIDDGVIGEPIAATAFMMGHGHESWHPDPDFYYQPGGGPMFDMGPYYLTALVNLIGPVRRVTGSTRVTFPERTITSRQKFGQKITVRTPTHVSGVLDFANGAIGNIITSFDVWKHSLPHIEIYGTEGSMQVPDPNGFGGPVKIMRQGYKDFVEVNLTHAYPDNSRGLGVADMAVAIRRQRAHRASGELANHVLDIMHAIHDASNSGSHVELTTTCERPAPMDAALADGEMK